MPGRATPTKELYHKLLNLLMSVSGTWPEELLLFEKYLAEHGAEDGYPFIINDLHFWVEVGTIIPAIISNKQHDH